MTDCPFFLSILKTFVIHGPSRKGIILTYLITQSNKLRLIQVGPSIDVVQESLANAKRATAVRI